MPARNSTGNLQQHTPLRRSPRLLQRQSCSRSPEQNPYRSKSRNTRASSISSKISFVEVSREACLESVAKKSTKMSSDCEDRVGLRRFEKLSEGSDVVSCLRRSPRFLSKREEEKVAWNSRTGESRKVSTQVLDNSARKLGRDSCSLSDRENDEVCAGSSKKNVVKNKRRTRRSCVGTANENDRGAVGSDSGKNKGRSRNVVSVRKSGNESTTNSTDKHVEESRRTVCLGLRALTEEERRNLRNVACQGNKEVETKLKRKCREEGNVIVQGWTKEQETALHRAYLAAKPTPHFWKKVSKQVPGKSAQECFDKIHADLITPPQPQSRSRRIGINSCPIEHFSLSASKLLEPTEPKNKKSRCNKTKSCVRQKKVRQLVQRHHHVNQDNDADLFSILEPDINPSTRILSDIMLSTPEHSKEKQDFLDRCDEMSSAGPKKTRSRFQSSLTSVLVSPPVLKPVKNKALHEKYIDRLHIREAKRKSVPAQTKIPYDKENRRPILTQNVDVVRTAKTALVSDARDVISQLQNLQTDTMSDSSDLNDNGGASTDDDEATFCRESKRALMPQDLWFSSCSCMEGEYEISRKHQVEEDMELVKQQNQSLQVGAKSFYWCTKIQMSS